MVYVLVVWAVLLAGAAAHSGHSEPADHAGPDVPRSRRRNAYRPISVDSYASKTGLVTVFSAGGAARFAARRALIRSTWGRFIEDTRLDVLFVIWGANLTTDALAALTEEAADHNDLLILKPAAFQGNTSATKLFEFLEWCRVHKTEYDYIIKVDQDVYVHPYHLQRLLATLSSNYQYWGRLQKGPNIPGSVGDVTYMAGWFVVLSKDMLQMIHDKQYVTAEVLRSYSNSSSKGLHSGLALGQVIKRTPVTVTMLESYPADDFELYDWGLFKQAVFANEEADDGQPPYETIGVHALRRTVDYTLMHDYFLSGLLRWKACTATHFQDPPRCQKVLNFEMHM